MDGSRFCLTLAYPGTRSGNILQLVEVPCDAQLVRVATCATNANADSLILGFYNVGSEEQILANSPLGAHGAAALTPATFNGDGVDGVSGVRCRAGDVLRLEVDGATANDVTIVLTFLEG